MSSTASERPVALVLEHGRLGPPGILGSWLQARDVEAVVHRVEPGVPLPDPGDFAFVASLGSAKSPRQKDDPLVRAELDLLATCVYRGIPVLGLCFGGQALATVLGGTVRVLDDPELGWHHVRSAVPEVVTEGPWLQWHYEAFSVPPGAEELASSPVCPQAFRHGVHLGTQFHPESTAEIVKRWAENDQTRLPGRLEDHLVRLREGDRRHGAAARAAAMRLFDAFWERAVRPVAPGPLAGRR